MIGALGLAWLGTAALAIEPELTVGAKTRPAGLAVLSDLWLACNNHHRRHFIQRILFHNFKKLFTIHARHHGIEKHDMRTLFFEDLYGFPAISGSDNLVPLPGQEGSESFDKGRFSNPGCSRNTDTNGFPCIG